jgi:TonB family protein
MRVVPTKMIDAALSGGGGDPTVKPSDELQKGSPEAPPKPQPEPPKAEPPKVTPQPAPPQPEPTPPPPRTTEKKSPLPLVETKRAPKPDAKSRADSIIAALTPAKRTDADKRNAQEAQKMAAAEARERSERAWNSQNQQLAKQIGSAVEGLSQGFEKGTVVKAYGPGGEAYANYADWVQQVYDDAWITPDMMSDEELHVEVRIVIHRSGRVIDARIEKKSGNRALDRSVQSAIDKVKTIKPFPEGSLDQQRTFNINFVPKFKRSTG